MCRPDEYDNDDYDDLLPGGLCTPYLPEKLKRRLLLRRPGKR